MSALDKHNFDDRNDTITIVLNDKKHHQTYSSEEIKAIGWTNLMKVFAESLGVGNGDIALVAMTKGVPTDAELNVLFNREPTAVIGMGVPIKSDLN